MRRSRLAIAFWGVVSFLASTTPICAKTQLGFGLSPCGQYNQLRQQAPEIGHAFDAWILGYLSGVNFIVYTSRGVDLLAAENSEKIIGYIQGYCSANPNKTVTEAANEYWFGLANQARK